ncbi:MAG: hypothetical protein Aurels2KO_12000 [Aureliella sp.]
MNAKLQEALQQLHTQLSTLDGLDDAERKQLENAAKEIQESLASNEVKSSDLAAGFQKAISRFSESHPELTRTAGQVAETLSQMGI